VKTVPTPDAAALRYAGAAGYTALDHLATMVAIVNADGRCVFANAAFENVLGLSRRSVLRGSLFDWFADPQQLRDTVAAVVRNDYATSRLEAQLKRPTSVHGELALPVHVIVNQTDRADRVIVEMIEIEQQTRQDREERALDQAQAIK
jgi:two-component system nitrogen regulation sensor histidine kinase GlnL